METVVIFALNVCLGAWLLAWTTEKVGKWKLENKPWNICFSLVVAKFFGGILGIAFVEMGMVIGALAGLIGFFAMLTYCVYIWMPDTNLKRTLKIIAAYVPLYLLLSLCCSAAVNLAFAGR